MSSATMMGVRKITAGDKRDLVLGEFLDGDLKGICFTVEGNKDGGIHTVFYGSTHQLEGFYGQRT